MPRTPQVVRTDSGRLLIDSASPIDPTDLLGEQVTFKFLTRNDTVRVAAAHRCRAARVGRGAGGGSLGHSARAPGRRRGRAGPAGAEARLDSEFLRVTMERARLAGPGSAAAGHGGGRVEPGQLESWQLRRGDRAQDRNSCHGGLGPAGPGSGFRGPPRQAGFCRAPPSHDPAGVLAVRFHVGRAARPGGVRVCPGAAGPAGAWILSAL
jgi:hypothetical protein